MKTGYDKPKPGAFDERQRGGIGGRRKTARTDGRRFVGAMRAAPRPRFATRAGDGAGVRL